MRCGETLRQGNAAFHTDLYVEERNVETVRREYTLFQSGGRRKAFHNARVDSVAFQNEVAQLCGMLRNVVANCNLKHRDTRLRKFDYVSRVVSI